ncbi:MAG: hypothetical protein Q4C70_10715, partial [Planctomycetia bacterium]|nr:hypothetical protein [Planctomycetia bacterium]
MAPKSASVKRFGEQWNNGIKGLQGQKDKMLRDLCPLWPVMSVKPPTDSMERELKPVILNLPLIS